MSFNFNKRSLVKTLFSSNKSCGCIKIKPSNVLEPSQKPKISFNQNTNPNTLTSPTTSHDANTHDKDFTSTTISNDNNNNYRILKPATKLIDSIAVEKESKEPYEDFRNSILQMILEREIYSENDLQELLECFLQLNAKCHHHVIVEAFMETCEEIFPKKLCGDGRRV
ncbi:putative transcription factor OFP family [Medicago truncatula]|uniref:Transcription repressor n=1 Tax=Medicago truncatula TaxID=3880 RepID=A0A396HWM6_MEDTR|nr:transcription repressor OFP10 [Medicago truncatula]RHN56961.1 putative transcription factor OFP family [Medicago truncatula]